MLIRELTSVVVFATVSCRHVRDVKQSAVNSDHASDERDALHLVKHHQRKRSDFDVDEQK